MNKWELEVESIEGDYCKNCCGLDECQGHCADFQYIMSVAKESQKKLWGYIMCNLPIGRRSSDEAEAKRLQDFNRSFTYD